MAASQDLSKMAELQYYREQYGFDKIPGGKDDEGEDSRKNACTAFASALCNALSGDGTASKDEIEWVKGYCSLKGYPISVIESIDDMAKKSIGKSPEQIATETKEIIEKVPIVKVAGRFIIYDAIRASGTDGFANGERDAIYIIAKELGVDKYVVNQLISLVEMEESVKRMRINILMKDGHPCLAEKYGGKPLL